MLHSPSFTSIVKPVDHVTPWAPAGGKAGIYLTPLDFFWRKSKLKKEIIK
jgi:hypothetical protein